MKKSIKNYFNTLFSFVKNLFGCSIYFAPIFKVKFAVRLFLAALLTKKTRIL